MKLMIITDAWEPQVNGVVRTLKRTKQGLEDNGFQVQMVTPLGAKTVACPTYSEIQLTLKPFKKVSQEIESFEHLQPAAGSTRASDAGGCCAVAAASGPAAALQWQPAARPAMGTAAAATQPCAVAVQAAE